MRLLRAFTGSGGGYYSHSVFSSRDRRVNFNASKLPPPSPPAPTAAIIPSKYTRPSSLFSIGPNLKKYSVNLTQLAEEKRLDPVFGRDAEILRMVQILSRRTKNNPCIIGEPGVGKTAVVEGLALRIIEGNVPSTMKDKVILSLDLPSMLAGAKFRGDFGEHCIMSKDLELFAFHCQYIVIIMTSLFLEERLKGVIKDMEMTGDRVILFIDEIHVLVDAGSGEGAIAAANILKPALARGSLRCVGATTLEEYRKSIERDAALSRRFQSVLVEEPSMEDSINILRGIAFKYERHHNIHISDGAILAAVELSNKYLVNRKLPDKAIDLMDEAASLLQIENENYPEGVNVLSTKINRDAMSIFAMERELRLLDSLSPEEVKENMHVVSTLKAQLESLHADNDSSVKARDSLISSWQANHSVSSKSETSVGVDIKEDEVHGEVATESIPILSAQHIANIVAKSTGIPVGSLLDAEKLDLLHMEVQSQH